jgi:hypothetical protein
VRVRIAVGDVDIRLDDLDLTLRQVRGLIKYAVGAAAAMAAVSPPETDETADPKHPLGFAATIERLPEEIPKEDLDWYFDE